MFVSKKIIFLVYLSVIEASNGKFGYVPTLNVSNNCNSESILMSIEFVGEHLSMLIHSIILYI